MEQITAPRSAFFSLLIPDASTIHLSLMRWLQSLTSHLPGSALTSFASLHSLPMSPWDFLGPSFYFRLPTTSPPRFLTPTLCRITTAERPAWELILFLPPSPSLPDRFPLVYVCVWLVFIRKHSRSLGARVTGGFELGAALGSFARPSIVLYH